MSFTYPIYFIILLLVLFQFIIDAWAAEVAEAKVEALVTGVLTKATDLAAEVLVLVEVANEAAEVVASQGRGPALGRRGS